VLLVSHVTQQSNGAEHTESAGQHYTGGAGHDDAPARGRESGGKDRVKQGDGSMAAADDDESLIEM
jgi:hypothetical protein